jgi:hypothetical protein
LGEDQYINRVLKTEPKKLFQNPSAGTLRRQKIGSKCSFTPFKIALSHQFLPCPALT